MWKRDRDKKAAYKKARAEKRLLALQDPFPKPKKSRSRKGKGKEKTTNSFQNGDELDNEDDEDSDDDATSESGVKPAPIVDLVTLTAQIRVFIADVGRQTMVLPPMEKSSRQRVHSLAAAFNLKSKSVGKGGGRHTTLIRTSRSGIGLREGKITALLKHQGSDIPFTRANDRRAGTSGGQGPVKSREGDVVGHKAAKINGENKGFQLLQRMGYVFICRLTFRAIVLICLAVYSWKEGERIGVTGGLAAPLTAVIKNTKLGLGAGTVRWST